MIRTEQYIQFALSNGIWMRIELLAPHTLRVRLNRTALFAEPPLIRYGVLHKPLQEYEWSVESTDQHYVVCHRNTRLEVDRQTGSFDWVDQAQRNRIFPSASPTLTPQGFGMTMTLEPSELLYGFGNARPERLQRRGSTIKVCVSKDSPFATVPFLMSSRGWGLLMNTTWDHTFDLGESNPNGIEIYGRQTEIDFFLFIGSDYRELLDRYTAVSGKPRLLPLWAYGLTFLSSIPSSEQSVTEAALKFRQIHIPCDMIDIPWDWMDEHDGAGELHWDPQRFPVIASRRQQPFSFIQTLKRHGFKTSLFLVDCGIDLTLQEEKAPVEPSWYSYLSKFVESGISAFVLSARMLSSLPHDGRWSNGMGYEEIHNLFPVVAYKQLHEGFVRQTGKRPMLFGPLGYTGIQQYAGVSNRDSDNSRSETISMLNCCLSGMTHTTANMLDMLSKQGIHAGFLQPWARSGYPYLHLQHPYYMVEPIQQLFRKYARLRYRLLPYLYATAHTAAATGYPMARAMPLAFPRDPACTELQDQYMLGDCLLVGVSDQVYLPEGIWVDYWTGESCAGGRLYRPALPEEAGGPLFVRGGSILPMWPDMEYVGQIPFDRIHLHVYPLESCRFELVEDDGETFDYLNGKLAKTQLVCEVEEAGFALSIFPRKGTYTGMPPARLYEVCLHTGLSPASVVVDGQRWPKRGRRESASAGMAGWHYDRRTRSVVLHVEENRESAEPLRIQVSYRPEAGGSRPVPAVRRSAPEPIPYSGRAGVLAAALSAGQLAMADKAVEAWCKDWRSSPDASWRLHLLEGCLLIIRHTESRGWKAADVFGSDAEAAARPELVRDIAEGQSLLLRLARKCIQFGASEQVKPAVHPVIRQTLAIVHDEMGSDLTLHQLADRLNVNASHLSRLFKQETGQTFSDYLLKQRMEQAKKWLESGMKVYEAAALTGYQDPKYFSRVFSKYWGVPPIILRR